MIFSRFITPFPRTLHTVALGIITCLFCLPSASILAQKTPTPKTLVQTADMIVFNARIATLDSANSRAEAMAVRQGLIMAIGRKDDILKFRGQKTEMLDARSQTVVPGLNDSHLHVIRGGLNYTMELRWDGLTSLKRGLEMIREQAKRTPPGGWIRVVGGWNEFQFAEKRLPTLQELNEASGNVPLFVLYLYGKAFLNKAGIKALGYTPEKKYAGGEIVIDSATGEATGLLLAKPNALILYSTLNLLPKLTEEEQKVSTRHFMRELNRLGVTSAADPGGGFQNYPDNYGIATQLAEEGNLSLRIAYFLFAQKPKTELQDYERWTNLASPGLNGDWVRPFGYVLTGGGENLVASGADFENFLEPRPDLPASLEEELTPIVQLLVRQRWFFRIHATYNETISRFLNVFEAVNAQTPFNGLRWAIDHAETISEENLRRIKALGGGIAVQGRMAYQGELFVQRYGDNAARATPPIKRMLELGIPTGLGTDGTRVANYNPWVSVYLFTTGKTLGGTTLYPPESRIDRTTALKTLTHGSAWFSHDERRKGTLEQGKFADFVILNNDYFSVADEMILGLEADCTVVGGQIVYAQNAFAKLNPPLPTVQPEWSPVIHYGGYQHKPLKR